MEQLKFDIVIHLAGEQIVPNYMALKLAEADRHFVLVTSGTKNQFERLKRMFAERGDDYLEQIEVLPTDYNDILAKLQTIVGLADRRVGVNITGGTKPMSVAALDYCRKNDFIPFYIDTQTRKIGFFAEGFRQIEMPKVFGRVDEFFALSGFAVLSSGKTVQEIGPDREQLVKAFWREKDNVRREISDFSLATEKRYQNQKDCPPECYRNAVRELLRIRGKNAKEVVEGWKTVFPANTSDWRLAARFGAGEWFEEWMLLQFANSKSAEEFLDLRSGITLSFVDDQNKKTVQEIDVAFTDGYTLTLIECKAGRVFQEHIQKLENITRNIGGAMGRGMLCAINQQYEDDVVVQRVKNGTVSLITGDGPLRMLPYRYKQIKQRKCYQSAEDYNT